MTAKLFGGQQDVLVPEEGWTDVVELWEEIPGHALKLGSIFRRDTIPDLEALRKCIRLILHVRFNAYSEYRI